MARARFIPVSPPAHRRPTPTQPVAPPAGAGLVTPVAFPSSPDQTPVGRWPGRARDAAARLDRGEGDNPSKGSRNPPGPSPPLVQNRDQHLPRTFRLPGLPEARAGDPCRCVLDHVPSCTSESLPPAVTTSLFGEGSGLGLMISDDCATSAAAATKPRLRIYGLGREASPNDTRGTRVSF